MGEEIRFVETFALAADRAKTLENLVPGTEDHFYYTCLALQHAGQLKAVDDTLTRWRERHGYSERVTEMENRQALLKLEKSPKVSWQLVQDRLGLTFDHEKEQLDAQADLPIRLTAEGLIDRATLMEAALRRYHNSVQGFEDTAIEWLAAEKLTPDRRRDLVRRLTRPDLPNLVSLVAEDLAYANSGGFGSAPIHSRMLLSQLDELVAKRTYLLNENNFINAYLDRLMPSPEVDIVYDPAQREQHLARLWKFVERLAPNHNSLRAAVLYQWLVHDRAQGRFDRERFLSYIQTPRRVDYLCKAFRESDNQRRFAADLNASFQPRLGFGPIGNDQPLVRSYLEHFFREDNQWEPFSAWIDSDFLKELFAETKLLAGQGDPERWTAMLSPETYQALKDRVEMVFAPTNKSLFKPADPVNIAIAIKNVKTLIIKVFELNLLNFYRENGTEVDTGINLDGLVANDEQVVELNEPPLSRTLRHFDFPALKHRGVYLIEFIGGGQSCRALIRKGLLRPVVQTTPAGHEFQIVDESRQPATNTSLWLGGRAFEPETDGTILVPFSSRPNPAEPVILAQAAPTAAPGAAVSASSSNGFAALAFFNHQAEQYFLHAGFQVERETLIPRRKSSVVIRPCLYLNDTPVSLELLEEVKLVLSTTDLDGVVATKTVHDFKLFEDREATFEFQVPDRMASLSFVLQAKVPNLGSGRKDDLSATASFPLNGIDTQAYVEDLHLSRFGSDYALELLGKTGEERPRRPVSFELKHRDFREAINVSLQTDDAGRIHLGPLQDILYFTASGPEGLSRRFELPVDQHSLPARIHARAGEAVYVPCMSHATAVDRGEISLIELRGDQFLADRFDAVSLANGLYEIRGLTPGDYSLMLKREQRTLLIRVSDAVAVAGSLLSVRRQLEQVNAKPLQIARVEATQEALHIHLTHATEFTRVHLAVTRFQPEFPLFDNLNAIPFPDVAAGELRQPASNYISTRNLGDEYTYVIERKYAVKRPGNMLTRPGALLNPWSIRKTSTSQQEIVSGEEAEAASEYAPVAQAPKPSPTARMSAGRGQGRGGSSSESPNFDFLADAAVLLTNLRPDKNGVVRVARADLGAHQMLHILAVDPEYTALRTLALTERPTSVNDLRLTLGLDPAGHFAEQKEIHVLRKAATFGVDDLRTAEFELYDTLGKTYGLFATLLEGHATFAEFGFLVRWPGLSAEEKAATYSKYACHELHFFLLHKDPQFFNAVVKPYLAHKKDKTFLDHWLLEEDLASYCTPWAYQRLNMLERILLARRVKGEGPHTARHIADLTDLIPPDIDGFNTRFDTALKSNALETASPLGNALDEAREAVRRPMQVARTLGGSLSEAGFGAMAAGASMAAPASVPPPSPPAKSAKMDMDDGVGEDAFNDKAKDSERSRSAGPGAGGGGGYRSSKKLARQNARQLYRELDKTEEWAENNYYKLAIESQDATLIPPSAFWRDYAAWDGTGRFLSNHAAEAARSFTEAVMALSVLDLPFDAPTHTPKIDKARLTLALAGDAVVFTKQIKPAETAAERSPILVSQNFFRYSDRYDYIDNEQIDKYVTGEFLTHVVYGLHVVVTNPSSARQRIEVLLEIPKGALPVLSSRYTHSQHVAIEPFSTETFGANFYFPAPGNYAHYPVHISRHGKVLTSAAPVTLKVVREPSSLDTGAWDYLSQHADEEVVLAYLDERNLHRIDLDKIAFRMRDKVFYKAALAILNRRHIFQNTLFSYGVHHKDIPTAREFLLHQNEFVAQCGAWLDTPLLGIDPVARYAYQHLEYSPLVNARAHALGKRRQIQNDRLAQQYHALLNVLSYRPELDGPDHLNITYYLLLQDRIDEAEAHFTQIDPKKLDTRLQYDYFAVYLDFFRPEQGKARATVKKYAQYPVDRWRNIFAQAAAQLAELDGKDATVKTPVAAEDPTARDQRHNALAATEAAFDFKLEGTKLAVHYQNLAQLRVNYYRMDIEMLFSRNPFVDTSTGQFAMIRPNHTERIELSAKERSHTFSLPAQFAGQNVMVEVEAGGKRRTQACFAHSLAVQLMENYGQLRVTHLKTGAPIEAAYLKVYAKMQNGAVQFFKDGYTDPRGKFDYTSVSTDELSQVERFAVLVLSEKHGAVVKEAAPPKA